MGRRLSTSFFWAFVFLVLGATGVVHAQTGPSPDELKLFSLVNQEREKAGRPKLKWDDHLAKSAGAHARRMANAQLISHQYAGEPELGERIGTTGLRFDAAGENVACAATVEEGHKGLMNSPPHRANILNPQFNALGVAVIARNGNLYIVQNFAHVLPDYSEKQFRDGVIAAFNKARRAKGITEINVRTDLRLREAACSKNSDPRKLLQKLPGATNLEVFTSSAPEKLPSHMQEAAADPKLQRMRIEVCFKPGKEHGYASFQVVAVFYPGN